MWKERFRTYFHQVRQKRERQKRGRKRGRKEKEKNRQKPHEGTVSEKEATKQFFSISGHYNVFFAKVNAHYQQERNTINLKAVLVKKKTKKEVLS